MKCRVLKTMERYDSVVKDVLGYTLWSLLFAAVIYMSFKA